MSSDPAHFAADWLALREPVDHRSRAAALLDPLNEFLGSRRSLPVRVADLGAGSGSNLRYLAPRLKVPAHWRLLDHDATLLRGAAAGFPPGRVATEVRDLAPDALDGLLAGTDLVTASALIDLVSRTWLAAFAAAGAAARAAILVALTIDGRVVFDPPDARDGDVLALVARDQQRDKGLGVALGARATDALTAALNARGYRVTTAASDWTLTAGDADLAQALLDGWREAAARQEPRHSSAWAAWAVRRGAAIASGVCRLRVGHQDLLAVPSGPG